MTQYTDFGAEILAAIERSKESGLTETTPVGPWYQDEVTAWLDKQIPGQHDGEASAIHDGGWHAWWSHEDGSHYWDIEIPLNPED